MNINALKGAVARAVAKTGVAHQSVYDMYFFERFLYRLSISEYMLNFVFKGGFLLENMMGISARTTMDIDLKLVDKEASSDAIKMMFEKICLMPADDEIEYHVIDVTDITPEMKYGGKSVKLEARCKNLRRIFNVDIAKGDVVTPYPQKYTYKSIIEDRSFELLAYTKETIIAEKFETLVAKGMDNSRAKDLFDICLLMDGTIDKARLSAAVTNTFFARGTALDKVSIADIINRISMSKFRRERYEDYAKKHSFAMGISFKNVMESIQKVYDSIQTEPVSLPNVTARLTLIRHGEDEQDKVGGWSDNKLTDNGRHQIEAMAETLTDDYDLMISSDLARAVETTEILQTALTCPVFYEKGLRETNNGDLRNMSKEAFIQRRHKRFSDMEMNERYPNGESPQNFYIRVKENFISILERHNGKKILLITHGGVITVILCMLFGFKYSNLLKIVLTYGSCTDITIENGNVVNHSTNEY